METRLALRPLLWKLATTMPSLIIIVDILAFVSFISLLHALRDHRRHQGLPYPPGPHPWPVIGNLFDIPKTFSFLAYTQAAKKYGDIISFHIFGQVIVVLNSAKATKDLFEKRGDIYSDRPVIPIFEMMGWQWFVPSGRLGEPWRLRRNVLDRGLRPGAAASYRPLQQTRTRVLLSRLLATPYEWGAHIEVLQGELILAATYGYDVQGHTDRKLEVARRMSDIASAVALPGALLVNHLPFLRYIPEWLPWLSYWPVARLGQAVGREVIYDPIRFVRESILNGTARPSLALSNLQETETMSGPERESAERVITDALGSMYAAGADTVRKKEIIALWLLILEFPLQTVAAILSFFLAVLLHPDTQARAQAELDAVTGRERLPTFEDRPQLPYVDALCKEVLRWQPVGPLSVPHATTQDDVYEGYFIPKGAIVIGNSWAILHDPASYPQPDAFNPERFLNADGSLRDDAILVSAFGYGKRICPGRHFVDATLFIVVASVLSGFNVGKEKGTGGHACPLSVNKGTDTEHLSSRPHPFLCSILPRDKKARELIIAEDMGL
ncbi:cytochrome P450 [Gloeopeniophorella convolvens]|nr:cytochrome P450 [Gloeopeniophorella convolvens]